MQEKDEFAIAFKDLIKFIEKARQTNESNNEKSCEVMVQQKEVEQDEQADYYGQYYSTLDTYGTIGSFGLKASSRLKIAGPSICEKIMDKLRYLVFNDRELLASTFDDEAQYQAYYDHQFAKNDVELEKEKQAIKNSSVF